MTTAKTDAPTLTIVGCGMGPADLTPQHHAAVDAADLLVGGPRLLAWFPNFVGETQPIAAHATSTVEGVIQQAATKRITVLASGDALFFGIARLFLGRLPAEQLTILPNVTAAQTAASRLHLPWASLRTVTVHGRTDALPWRTILGAEGSVIYCDHHRTPAVVAGQLVQAWPAVANRPATIVANLGANERIEAGTLGELQASDCGGMSMLVLPPVPPPLRHQLPPLPLGRDDATYAHQRGLITHPEIRAIVLSKLQVGPGVLWDLGAGSGSVSVEAAGLCESLHVEAVEAKAERCDQIRDNATAAGCRHYHVTHGDSLACLPDLPDPRAIFVGGGGAQVEAIVTAAWARLLPGGNLVVAAIMEQTKLALQATLPTVPRDLLEIAVRRATPLGTGTMLKPDNPVSLFIFRKVSS